MYWNMDASTNIDEDLESKIYNVDKDPNKNGLIPVNSKCEYYTEEQFNDKVMKKEHCLSSISTGEV